MLNKFLTYSEAAEFSGFSVGTLRNLVSRQVLKRGVHYTKPHGRKILFSSDRTGDGLDNLYMLSL